MAQYIDKEKILEKIEKEKKYLKTNFSDKDGEMAISAYNIITSFIDTLEVKEIGVDIGSPEGDWSSKTVQFIDADGNKTQEGE